MSTAVAETSYRRAVALMTGTSFLVPAAGLITAPLLAHALSTGGRGQLAAALAPAGLMLAAATLGLPDALTYYLAKRPQITRQALFWASSVTLVLGAVCSVIVWSAVPFLRDGDTHLGRLILLGTLLTIPALVIGVFRGAATGRQMWGAVAAERLINTIARVGACVALFVLHDLTVMNALLMSVLTPIVAGVAYLPLLRRPTGHIERRGGSAEHPNRSQDSEFIASQEFIATSELDGDGEADMAGMRSILTFGSRVWFGSVVSMLLDRSAQILMAPLSNVSDLGVYTVANTISDLPLIVALAISGALFGVNAKTANVSQVTNTSRLTLLAGFSGCAVIGVTLPWWIVPLFGEQFRSATGPTILLMASAVVCIPGMMAAAGLAAWGRPGLRSIGLAVTLVVNLSLFVLLVPPFGAIGACWTSIISSAVMTGYMLIASKRVMGVPVRDLVLIRRSDVLRIWSEGVHLWKFVVDRTARR